MLNSHDRHSINELFANIANNYRTQKLSLQKIMHATEIENVKK
jgi:hypothetical protein